MKIGGSDCGEENNSYLSEQNRGKTLVYILRGKIVVKKMILIRIIGRAAKMSGK